MKKQNYLAPEIEIIEVQTEHGFALSDMPIEDWDNN